MLGTMKKSKKCSFEQNIFGLFHTLIQFIFRTSEMELDYYKQKVNMRVISRAAE